MPKALAIADMRYKRKGQTNSLRELLKYLQYRDGSVRRDAYLAADPELDQRYPEGVSDYVKPSHRETRWVDRGMGESYREITNQAEKWQGRSVLARTWVISPDPELMVHVPEEKRFELVGKVTEKTMNRWYSDNGWGQAEYSYVIHDKHLTTLPGMEFGEAKSPGISPQGRTLPMAHAHVITPGTIPIDSAEDLGRVDHIVKRPHLRDLGQTVGEAFEEELGLVLGKDRAQELIAERDARIQKERYPNREKHDRLNRLKTMGDVMSLLKAEKDARDRKKNRRKQKRSYQQKMAEVRMYARYVNEQRQKRREADWKRMALLRQQEQSEDLSGERAKTQAALARARENKRNTFDLLQEEVDKLEALRAYFENFTFEEPEREQELER